MKKLFWIGATGLILFEVANVYFIMPFPGSQRMNSIDAAYFLYTWRWAFRIVFCLMIMAGLAGGKWRRRWVPALFLIVPVAVIYMANFVMAADHMFYQPRKVLLADASTNKVDSGRLVLGISINGESKAYPIRFLGYHHQVQDTVGGKPVIVTYCTVCRTGRVYEPLVNGHPEKFRLVGMDHFNAMFEDATTKSWWRQVTGEAIAGELKGAQLPTVLSTQTSLGEWLRLNPRSLVMQADSSFIHSYDTTNRYEAGHSKSSLTRTDSVSWKDKSWVIGVMSGKHQKVYDWNYLKEKRIVNDEIDGRPVAVLLTPDNKGFFAFQRPTSSEMQLSGDTLLAAGHRYEIDGKGIDTGAALKQLQASQEFWHSWRTFYPATMTYTAK